MSSPSFPDLILLEKEFALFRLAAQSSIPPQILAQLTGTGSSTSCSFISVTRTPEEVSIVTDQIPADLDVQDSLWRCIKIKGPLTHDLTGILNNLSTPLRDAEVPIFAVSTWDTDYVLVPKNKVDEAVNALLSSGWKFLSA
ncbi:hypothetical protein FRC04_008932 [Tulasnella sp. 424]|nr:hypothetical protein FRC04_008932 [Tulasnella sp. 424]KAG8973829.1 hypothetical protein FRC05_008249 [Tulasnella sp. 425]